MRRLVAVLGTATLTLTLGGCHTPETTVDPTRGSLGVGNGSVYCTVMADPVRVDAAKKIVLAPGRFRCDRPGADSLTITVVLEKRDQRGAWVPIQSATFSSAGAETTRDLDEDQRTREVSTPCLKGSYRTSVTATVVSRNAEKQHAMRSADTVDPCTRLSARR